MPREFLLQQMAWREALDDAADAAAVQALDDAVALEERALHRRLQALLDEQSDTAAAAGQVRALMFVTRFREALAQRLARLQAA
jgi:molecular chaperone HscB